MQAFLRKKSLPQRRIILSNKPLICQVKYFQLVNFLPVWDRPLYQANDEAAKASACSSFTSILTLALLVLGVLADDHDFALALDDLALLAHGLHGRSDFHLLYLLLFLLSACETAFHKRRLALIAFRFRPEGLRSSPSGVFAAA